MQAHHDLDRPASEQLNRCREIPGFESLVAALGYDSLADWLARWAAIDGLSLAHEAWPVGVDPRWIASVGLPLLDQVQQSPPRSLLGLAAMPGCGKSTLCAWIKAAAARLGMAVEVLSLDDFYFPGEQLESAMAGNPWQAPRGIPGSHDAGLLLRALQQWRNEGTCEVPVFDKALRQGRGDRAGTRLLSADRLILEGWFVGAGPWAAARHGELSTGLTPLSPAELAYRPVIERNLAPYQAVWRLLDGLWQLSPTTLSTVLAWKRQQNQSQQQQSGSALAEQDLETMTRSLQVSIPESALVAGRSADVVLRVDAQRQVQEVRLAGG